MFLDLAYLLINLHSRFLNIKFHTPTDMFSLETKNDKKHRCNK